MSHPILGALALVFCYLVGSILWALIISECGYGVDIRKFGSGNCGFTNMKRVLGWKPALAVLILDAAKGAAAILLCRKVFVDVPGDWGHSLVLMGGILAIMGHNWSLFFNFAGGKGVATSLGVLIALDWRAACLALAVGILLLIYPGYMSVASALGTASAQLWFWLLHDPIPYRVFGLVVLVFVMVRHRANWERLRNGTEPRFSFGGKTDSPEELRKTRDETSHS